MKSEESDSIVLMTLIARRELKDDYLAALSESGIHLVNSSFGRGFVEAGYLEYTFGLARDIRVAVMLCVSTQTKADAFLKRLVEEFDFDEPHTGIAFTMPIDNFLYTGRRMDNGKQE